MLPGPIGGPSREGPRGGGGVGCLALAANRAPRTGTPNARREAGLRRVSTERTAPAMTMERRFSFVLTICLPKVTSTPLCTHPRATRASSVSGCAVRYSGRNTRTRKGGMAEKLFLLGCVTCQLPIYFCPQSPTRRLRFRFFAESCDRSLRSRCSPCSPSSRSPALPPPTSTWAVASAAIRVPRLAFEQYCGLRIPWASPYAIPWTSLVSRAVHHFRLSRAWPTLGP